MAVPAENVAAYLSMLASDESVLRCALEHPFEKPDARSAKHSSIEGNHIRQTFACQWLYPALVWSRHGCGYSLHAS